MKVNNFEDLSVWINSREFVKEVYDLTYSEKMKNDFSFKDQIRRASISIMNNIAEGFERDSKKEFIKFLSYSKGSAGEVRSMIYTALDLNYITEDQFKSIYNKSLHIIKQIAKLSNYLKSCNF